MPLVLTDTVNHAFYEIIQEHLSSLHHYCLSLAGSKWDGEDLFQETLIRAYKSWKGQDRKMNKAYLYRIASNLWIDEQRKHSFEQCHDVSVIENMEHPEPLDRAGLKLALTKLVKELTPKQRIVFLLTEGFGFDSKSVSQTLHMSEGAVKAVLHRARRRLQKVETTIEDYDECDEVNGYVEAIVNGLSASLIQMYESEQHIQMCFGPSHVPSYSPRLSNTTLGIQKLGHSQFIVSWVGCDGQLWMIPMEYTLRSIIHQNEEGLLKVA